jgi:KTSC domain
VGIRSLLNRFFGKKPSLPKGNRGIRAVNIRKPMLTQVLPGKPAPYAQRVAESLETPEGVEIPASEVEEFLQGGTLVVSSSNVASFQFSPQRRQLYVQYLNGSTYEYDNVSPTEAMEFVHAHSKGGKIWDLLRVRGSKTGHRKPFRKVGVVRRPAEPGKYGGHDPLGNA